MRLSQGLIIDVDGTLVDSNDARAQAWSEALAGRGYHVSFQELRRQVGLTASEVLVRTIGFGLDTEIGRAIYKRQVEIFRRRLLRRLTPFHRASELVARLAYSGLRLAVASQDPQQILLPLLRVAHAQVIAQRTGVPENLAMATSNRDVIKSALDRVGASPPHVLMVADAPYDIEAANALNIPVIALCSGGFTPKELSKAIAIYDDAEHLLAELERSPIASLLVHGQPNVA